MNLRFLPDQPPHSTKSFRAGHPMFTYDVARLSDSLKERVKKADHLVVLGIGGSTIPLKVFLDALQLEKKVSIIDTVDPLRWQSVKDIPNALYFVVSKSGETLEIKTLLAELYAAGLGQNWIAVTDPEKGSLRDFAKKNGVETIDIPTAIGGRFTNFTPFHRLLLENFGVDFDGWLKRAQYRREFLQRDSEVLEKLFQMAFGAQKTNLVIWAYGARWKGLADWIQQVIAESLGKKTADGKRIGVFPIVLQGPQDQHSVLQLLMDGPQVNSFWFLVPTTKPSFLKRDLPPPLEDFNALGGEHILHILAESTIKTLEERLKNRETFQSVTCFDLNGLEDLVDALVTIQAFIEYAAQKLNITPFDQPGVERGKQIARELLFASKKGYD